MPLPGHTLPELSYGILEVRHEAQGLEDAEEMVSDKIS